MVQHRYVTKIIIIDMQKIKNGTGTVSNDIQGIPFENRKFGKKKSLDPT